VHARVSDIDYFYTAHPVRMAKDQPSRLRRASLFFAHSSSAAKPGPRGQPLEGVLRDALTLDGTAVAVNSHLYLDQPVSPVMASTGAAQLTLDPG
jgi:hypothetical protein